MARRRCPDFARILKTTSADQAIREQVARCFFQEMQRAAVRRCGEDGALAEDAAQDALLTGLEKLDTFRGDAPLVAWMRRLVGSACSRLRRGRKNNPRLHVSLADDSPAVGSAAPGQEASLMLQERMEILRETIAELPTLNRSLLLLHEGEDVSLRELAERFGLSVDSVKSRLRRTRTLLRQRLLAKAEEELP